MTDNEKFSATCDEDIIPEPLSNILPVPFYSLFRFSTSIESFLIVFGILSAVAMGCWFPFIFIVYGEYTTLLVDRNVENITSTPTIILSIFDGGHILENGTQDERYAYLLQDSSAAGIACTVCGAILFILGVLSVTCFNFAAQLQIGRIRKLFLRAVMRQEMSWYDTHNTSVFASRLTEDLDKMLDGIGEKVGIFTYLVSLFISAVIVSLLYGWKLTLVILCCSPFIIISTAVAMKVQSSLATKELESYGEAGAVVEEVLSSIRTVIAFGGESKEIKRYTEKLKQAEIAGIKRGLYSGLGSGIMWFVIYIGDFIAFIYGIELILDSRNCNNKEYTPEILVIILFAVVSGAINLGFSSPHLQAFAMARGSAAAVFSVIDQTPVIDSFGTSGKKPSSIQGNITLRDVRFSYPSRPQVQVLKGLTLNINRGETVALVGTSGCGKSTVIQLIQRLYDPSHGAVCVDGIDMKELNVSWLRRCIGVVGQEPVLFGTTIAENIQYGKEYATQTEIELAAKKANAHDFISELPDGYSTLVGERGAQLSGGQKQRIAIARALIREPTILLLDEATSALDAHSEAKVQDALDRASKGRTTVIVAHRLSTIRNADRIIYISNGQVVEEGTHEDLMAHKSYYWSQVTAEDLSHKENDDFSENVTANSHVRQKKIFTQSSRDDAKDVDFSMKKDEEKYDIPFCRIMELAKPEWFYNLVGCISSVAVGLMPLGFPIILGEFFRILALDDQEEIRYEGRILSGFFIVIGTVCGLGYFLQIYMFGKSGVNLTTRFRLLTLSSMLKQEMGWYDEEKNGVGILCARLSSDASNVHGATGIRIGMLMQSVCTLLIGVIISLYYSWKLTLVCLVIVPLVMCGVYTEGKVIRLQGVEEKNALEKATKIAVEAISNLRTIASLGAELKFLEQYEKELAIAVKATRIKTILRGPVFALAQSGFFFGYALAFYYGGNLVVYDSMPYEYIIKVSGALIFGAWILGQSFAFAPNYSDAKMAAGRLFKIIDRKPCISSAESGNIMTGDDFEIKYSNIMFSYPTRPGVSVLQGLNLLVQQGKNVALVGPSGCGKSTCIQLLQRFYDPIAGTVAFNGLDIKNVSLHNLRSQIGLVSQEPVLFDRTIAENIAYGDNDREVSMTEIIEAAKKANIHSFISGLPLGYNTRLGTKGTQISGGQKQRIAIARAIIRNPRILLLDEATSALDTQSQKVVQDALDQAQEGRTCITITHRLVTIRQADVICVINQGMVAEMGSHAELVTKGGLYFQLLNQSNKQQ